MDKKPSLFSAANDVERMIYEIENTEGNIDAQIVEDFAGLRSNMGDAVDRCLYRLSALDMYIEVAEGDLGRAKDKLAKLKTAKAHMERYVLACVKSVSYVLKGERGEFSLKEPPGKVEFTIPVKDNKSYSNVITTDADNFAKIDQKYLERIEIFRVRKDDVLRDLRKGERVPFATLDKEPRLEWKKSMKALL